jgi:hypothetical protein
MPEASPCEQAFPKGRKPSPDALHCRHADSAGRLSAKASQQGDAMVTNPGAYRFLAPARRGRIVLSAAIFGVGVLLAPMATAQAQGYQGPQDAQAACTPDVFRLCSQFIPNRDPIVACLIRSRAALSPECRAVFKEPTPTRVAKARVAKKVAKSRKVRRAKRVR